ncbi:SDR family oxidoreductase [Micromonospora sp. NPDC049891]|uniref:type I polyketide synthase n=1 Tax=Micromonospora sp. NPDC049891 TaxID=3155655 RepID=UPI0033F8ED0B
MSDSTDDLSQVAIIGMAGRFPQAADVNAFWANLVTGQESISSFSVDELRAAGVSPALASRPDYVRAKGVLDGADTFDAGFFGFSPREAELMDPQHRVLLECAWEAVESAGYDPQAFPGRIGVFAGASMNTYLLYNLMANRSLIEALGPYQTQLANDKDFLATRVAYKLGLRGPAVTVQTACSTSLVAVHLACQSLLSGESDMVLAGGVSVNVPLRNGHRYEPGGILSADGHCRPFDAAAGGTVIGNGVALVVLRRLADARKHGDTIDAVIRGSAVNNDGALKVGYTAPAVEGQSEVIAEALGIAGVAPETVGYVETHGTGTALGDPIEIAGLTRAYGQGGASPGSCAIGSVKSNIGHLDAAAGAASLIKATLALKHEVIPASLHVERPNPELALETSPFLVNGTRRPWPRTDQPRRAGVSSFGIGGTNAHVVLEEGPAAAPAEPGRPWQLLPLSARTTTALAQAAERLADHLEAHPDEELADVAFTLATRRRAFEQRRAVVAVDRADAVRRLRRAALAEASDTAGRPVKVAFLFPGQGTQHAGMARDLYDDDPVFRTELDRCLALFPPAVRAALFPTDGPPADLTETELAQPALFAVEYALARTLIAAGVRPDALAGHSIGEYVAACLAGVFRLEDAAALVTARARLMGATPHGAMLAVFLPEAETVELLGDRLSLAAVNGAALCVASGPADAVNDLERRLVAGGIGCRRLHTSHAFHSTLVEDAVRPFVAEVREVMMSAPRTPICSNLTGTWIEPGQATDPEYWGAHLRSTVRFADNLGTLLADPDLILVEVGPGDSLSTFAKRHPSWTPGRVVAAVMRRPDERRADRQALLEALGTIWAAGVPLDWTVLCDDNRRRLRLPSYPFQRRRYWVEPDRPDTPGPTPTSVSSPTYRPSWRRLQPVRPRAEEGAWLVLGADLPLGRALCESLPSAVRVRAGTGFAQDDPDAFTIDPANREDYRRLFDALGDHRPARVVHLWSLAVEPGADLDRAEAVGFHSLLAFAQALAGRAERPAVALDVLTRGVFSVTGDECLQPENATLVGPCTVVPQEVPGVTCRLLDLGGASAESLALVLRSAPDEPVLARRGSHWWARTFDAVDLDPGPATGRLRDDGVYLITGGLGGIGLALAEHLARSVRAPAIGLLGRTPMPPEETWSQWLTEHDADDPTSVRIRRLQALRDLGARPMVLRADVTDLAQTTRAVDELRARFGALSGVVHAAGLPASGLLAGMSRADADAVLAAKTRGTLVLDAVCGRDPLDFVLLCSSRTAILGGPGQLDYCAANAFLDTFAATRDGATAVAWDTWRDTGMASDPAGGADIGHPLLHRRLRRTATVETFRTTITTADSWIVDEHRMQGHGLVPGTTYLEMVRAAVAPHAGRREIEFRDVLFIAPVIVPDGQEREMITTVERGDDGVLSFRVHSRGAAGQQEHCVGTVVLHDPVERPRRAVGELLDACDVREVIEGEDALRRRLRLDFAAEGGLIRFAVHGRWRCLTRIDVGTTGMIATLDLPERYAPDLDTYLLHPALLDVVGGASRVYAAEGYYLPFWYGSLRFVRGLTGRMTCHIRVREGGDSSGETLTCDADVHDEQGRLLVRMRDFTMKRVHDPASMRDEVERAAAAGPDPSPAGLATLLDPAGGLTVAEGGDLFDRILAIDPLPAQVVVSARDLAAAQRAAAAIDPARLAAELAEATAPATLHPRPDLDIPYEEPAPGAEADIAAIWREVLGIERIGRNDDFFALGGHSLAAVQIGTKLRARFGVELTLRDFFDQPTVANTSRLMAGTGDVPTPTPIEPIADGVDELTDDEVDAMLRELMAAEGGGEA